MKKMYTVLACLLLVCTCTGCGSDGNNADVPGVSEQSSTAESVSTAGTAAADAANTTAVDSAASADGSTTAANADAGQPAQDDGNGSAQTDAPAPADDAAADTPADSVKIGSEPTVGIAGEIKAKAGDKKVPVTLHIWNNPGCTGMGMRIYYDGALSPVIASERDCESEVGPAAENMLTTCMADVNQKIVAFATMAIKVEQVDGDLVTMYFEVPADAAPGTKYPLKLEMVDFATAGAQDQTVRTIDSAIVVE